MRVLGIETATSTASVGIIGAGRTLVERTRVAGGSHASFLIPLIDEVLAAAALRLSGIDLLAVSIGPGTFTGLRIGLSVAKGLALAAGKPVVGVPTLTALAYAVGQRPGSLLCPVLDARKHEVYSAAFTWSGRSLAPVWEPVVLRPEALAERLRPPCLLCGDGVDAYEPIFRRVWGDAIEAWPSNRMAPSAAAVATLAVERYQRDGADNIVTLEPAYVRPPEAERSRNVSNPQSFSA